MRMAGRITDWNDDKGFGFVTPHGGGARAFVHVNAFQRGSRRPVDGDLISYVATVDARGRTNAGQVRHAGQRIQVARTPSRLPRAVLGVVALACVVLGGLLGAVPIPLMMMYVGSSAVSYGMYAPDKRSARNDARRIPETNLHIVDLLGGWPGALVAQQQFRHKTAKPSFQVVFWMTVAFNVAVAGWATRSGWAEWLARLVG